MIAGKKRLPQIPYRLITVALINGAVIMIVELTGSRIVAPYFGSSLYVWTAIIGSILVALSVGYWYGGRLSDRFPSERVLARILLVAAIVLLVTRLVQDVVLTVLASLNPGVLLGSILATIVLFIPTTFTLGMVSPFVAKLTMRDQKHAGEGVGLVFSAGTIGSIVGTFLTGYVLFQYIGSARIILLCVAALLLASMLLYRKKILLVQVALLIIVGVLVLQERAFGHPIRGLVLDIDSAYSRLIVSDRDVEKGTLRVLQTDALGAQSGVYVDSTELPFDYTRAFLDAAAIAADGPILLIGGGAFTVPRELAHQYPGRNVDIVEIDPVLSQVARDYFGYTVPSSHQVLHEDARTFINQSDRQYSLILSDAFQSLSPPFQLTTREAIAAKKKNLRPGGLLVMNTISRPDSDKSFLAAQYATLLQEFRYVKAYRYVASENTSENQNIFVIASDQGIPEKISPELGAELTQLNLSAAPVLTDDFAPVESLLNN
ncbi:MAG: hypothetical protein QG658_68 [Patescibacteria group bacterium]|nr:hypothetical protein [Patescibacteria group bacterium]